MSLINNPILLAQCKAYHSIDIVSKELETLLKIDSAKDFNIHISLPFSYIEPIYKKFSNHEFQAGAEVLLPAEEVSFSESIAGKILQSVQAKFVLIGTPEERLLSTPHQLNNKIKAALNHEIQPFVCISDTLQEHQDKTNKQSFITQIKNCLDGLSPESLTKIFIVYNAEWISQTPWEAKSPELEEAYATFRDAIQEVLGSDILSSLKLIVAVPAFSQDVAQLIQNLKAQPIPFSGYSIGILSESAEYLQPLVNKVST